MSARLLPLLLLAGCAISNPWQSQRSLAETLKPAEVKPAAAERAGALRSLRVRAYADADYQSQTPRWRQHIAEQIERASAVLEAQFGVRLEVESVRPWRRAGPSAPLSRPIEQLHALDAGAGVDWVVGFVSSLDVFSASHEQMGIAGLFARHFVLRGMFSAAETDALNEALNLHPAAERESLARERRLHEETAVFLHEWAHTLGAWHERSAQSLMSPIYDKSQSTFSQESARIVGLGIEFRGSPVRRETWGKAYREELSRSGAAAWDAAARQQAAEAAERFFAAGPASAAPRPTLPPDDARRLEEAVLRQRAGDFALASRLVVPLVERHPRSEEVQELACALAQQNGASGAQLLTSCRAAAQLPGAQPHVLLLTAHLLLGAGSNLEALPFLLRAEKSLGDAAEKAAWLWLAQLDLQAGAWSSAARAAEKARGEKGAEQIAAECARMRSFVGFPPDGAALPAEREADYVAAALAAHQDINDRRADRALARARDLAKAFPGTPGAAVIECRARSRGKALGLTRTACATAAQAAPGAFFPQYILGLVAGAEAHWQEAEASMRRALEIDGGTREVWSSLAAVRIRLGDAAGLSDLRARYRSRFGAALVPRLWPAGWAAR